jgi:group II intron reverse transcriptase/maturase
LDESQKTLQRLERLRQLNTDRQRINTDLYRLMYKRDLYIFAYERMKSAPGNMTPGTDGKTLDGFSLQMIDDIIQEMRTDQFQFQPARTVYIPKANGKKRKLGIPSTRDKIVQEVMRLILECIYESPHGPYFHDTSHGFRPNRSCHTALREIRAKWPALNWFLEGDIRSCFDEIDHSILVNLLRSKIRDERFLNLIWKLLRAGYFDLQEDKHESLAGTPQGGLASPILANVYLHELDEKMQEIQTRYQRGEKKHPNPLYKKLSSQKERLVKKGATRTKTFRELVQQIRSIPAMVVNDPTFIRIKYLRYADDWIVGISGPRNLAEQVKEEIATFLSQHLKLTLSTEKTKITHARKEQARFLGTYLTIGRGGVQRVVTTSNHSKRPIRRRSTGSEMIMTAPLADLIKKLSTKGFCTVTGQPTTKKEWIHLEGDQLILLYNGINRGIQNYYRFTDNFSYLTRIQYILQFSLAHTLAAKYKCSHRQIFKRFGKTPTIQVPAKDGNKERCIPFYYNSDWKKRRNGFHIGRANVDRLRWSIRLRSRSKLGMPCCICNSAEQVEMHHVRHIRKIGGEKPIGINAILRTLNRKQLPVCAECQEKTHRGEYDGLRLSDLAYNPYPSKKRRRFRESCMQ